MEDRHYLYLITNRVNDRRYVGITCNPDRRKHEHFYKNVNNSNTGIVRKAVEKYGVENFTFEVLVVGSRSYVVDLEEKIIEDMRIEWALYNIRAGGEDCGSGHSIEKRSDDVPIYCFGFWFPNGRTAAKALNKGKTTIYRNKDREIQTKPTLYMKRPRLGSKEDTENRKRRMKGLNAGKENGMYGRTGAKHPRSRRIEVHGVEYDSISDAVRQTDLTKSIIEKSLKKNKPGFKYLDQE
jgi:group I intron endonuclease